MFVVDELLQRRAGLDDDAVERLQLLLSDWQILADLSFADLLLWVPCGMADGQPAYLCAGHMRPYTAQTIYQEDLVGQVFPVTDRPMVGRALSEQRVIRDADPDWSTGVPVREEAIPVRLGDRIVAVVTREANVSTARSPSQLELTYLQSAGELAQMLADGSFPYAGETPEERELSPRVGDGIMRFDAEGVVTYASPNAVSAYRRLGNLGHLVGQHLADFDPDHVHLVEALRAGEPLETEVERHGAVVLRRLLPLLGGSRPIGGLLLAREVTELRRHERALRLKDATIREIHHRVKNNLQTVASLLRLQGRRLRSEEAREALAESVRRISSIALVHETLSQESRERVSFDKVAARIVDMLADGLVDPEGPVAFEVEGSPGELPAEIATPLALVLTELLQNSVEHAFPQPPGPAGPDRPSVRVVFERAPATLRVMVCDNGVGLPAGGDLERIANLGLQIVRTLVESDLGGTLAAPPAQGTTIEFVVPLP
ncbi:MAG TPA: histidine kinase N-terminal domain-containing protein [Egibacteraceae bacterium]|nr:PAS domain-containing sensor histidine kinase [Actinomycetota bacterium]HWB73019.1 histidine kinase N-terminal domain-containing protein [Egibacteraceae bacterium]